MKKLAILLAVVLCVALSPIQVAAATQQEIVQMYNNAVQYMETVDNVMVVQQTTMVGADFAPVTMSRNLQRVSYQLGSGDNVQLSYRLTGTIGSETVNGSQYYRNGNTYFSDTDATWKMKGFTGYYDAFLSTIFATDTHSAYTTENFQRTNKILGTWSMTSLEDGGVQITRVVAEKDVPDYIDHIGFFVGEESRSNVRNGSMNNVWVLDAQGRITAYRTFYQVNFNGYSYPLSYETAGTIRYGVVDSIKFPANLDSYPNR